MKKILILILFINNTILFSQPGYELIAKNFEHGELPSSQVDFDIYLIHTDTTRFEYAGGKYCFNFHTEVANGGILSYQIIDSELPPNLRPGNPTIIDNHDRTSQLRLSINTFPGAGNGLVIPPGFPGIKIMTMRLSTTASVLLTRFEFPNIFTIDLRLRWRESPQDSSTQLYSYIGGLPTEITNPAGHSIDSTGLRVYPVELISFTSGVNKNNITLKWTTAVELNNSGFEIERKSINTDEWKIIGFVSGNGTTNEPKDYGFTDRVSTGKYNYRLKQIDYNGNFEYFNLDNEIEVGRPSEFKLSQNYPNPFNPKTKIDFNVSKDGILRIEIFDNTGKLISTLINQFMNSGYYTIDFDAANFSSGIYFYKLTAGNYSDTKRIVLLK